MKKKKKKKHPNECAWTWMLEKRTRESRRQTTNLSSLWLSSTSCCLAWLFNTQHYRNDTLTRVLSFICTNGFLFHTFIIIVFIAYQKSLTTFSVDKTHHLHSFCLPITSLIKVSYQAFVAASRIRFDCAMVDLNSCTNLIRYGHLINFLWTFKRWRMRIGRAIESVHNI